MENNDSNQIVAKVNLAELVELADDGKAIVVNPEAETSILRLLEVQKVVDEAVERLKLEIEKQALDFNPNFSAIKGTKLKINYSAAGAKYKATGTAGRHDGRIWTKKVSWSLDSKAVDEYKAKRGHLPAGIIENVRTKSIRISEVKND